MKLCKVEFNISNHIKSLVIVFTLFTFGFALDLPDEGLEYEMEIPNSAIDIHPLDVGQTIPKLTLMTPDNITFNLNATISIKPTILIFYRGGWCPYCNRHFEAIRTIEPDLLELGYQIIAISPDRPEVMREHAEEKGFSYQLLSDSDMTAAKAFGLAFKVDDATLTRYTTKLDIDIEADSGYDHHLLPVPAVFIIGMDGVIKFSYVNPNYKVRIEADVLLKVAIDAID